MKYDLIKELIQLAETFESNPGNYPSNINGFKQWVHDQVKEADQPIHEPVWEGKEKGRTPESVINTLIVHMNRYAKTYSKSAIHDSAFSTQEEFIYLVNLKAFGAMSKMELIKKNIQDKPAGMQIINRLIQQGWVEQKDSETDKRSKIIGITPNGLDALAQQMDKIRHATNIVTGDLSYAEKMELIRLLNKLDHFHHAIYSQNYSPAELLEKVTKEYLPVKN
ncbi:DNA-binding MarR family transcriptional regulator [Chitinophaga skermanii]|uniref:DNA-binding MarR family transcriptional regulator n=1 Tax=Chitinophaga skermanii TaxID=331697 RepID=A0A327QCD2_9BACT|nr:helix-turn-helix domain-containing protein [Chitinophaga skermanii]RAJ01528.1 DNA-binding MarR family transcriptional regulator [Chitinophaga skermanii]